MMDTDRKEQMPTRQDSGTANSEQRRMPASWNQNRLTAKLGIEYPIIQGPLGGLSSQRLSIHWFDLLPARQEVNQSSQFLRFSTVLHWLIPCLPLRTCAASSLLRQADLASARKSLCRGLGSSWFAELFHRNPLVTHFQHGQIFCTARQLKDHAVTRCRLHQRAPQR
jgi:hypothetical protein